MNGCQYYNQYRVPLLIGILSSNLENSSRDVSTEGIGETSFGFLIGFFRFLLILCSLGQMHWLNRECIFYLFKLYYVIIRMASNNNPNQSSR